MGVRQVQQALLLQTQGQDREQETCPDDKREVAGYQVLQTTVRACTHWSLPETLRPLRGRYMLVVCRDFGPDTGAPLPPLQPMERPAGSPVESGGKGDRLESRQIPTHAGLWAVIHGRLQSRGDWPLCGYCSNEVRTRMIGGRVWSGHRGWLRCREQRQWIYIFSFLFCLFVYLWAYICYQRRRVAGGELGHLGGSPGGGMCSWSCHTLIRVRTVCIHNNNNNNELSYRERYCQICCWCCSHSYWQLSCSQSRWQNMRMMQLVTHWLVKLMDNHSFQRENLQQPMTVPGIPMEIRTFKLPYKPRQLQLQDIIGANWMWKTGNGLVNSGSLANYRGTGKIRLCIPHEVNCSPHKPSSDCDNTCFNIFPGEYL